MEFQVGFLVLLEHGIHYIAAKREITQIRKRDILHVCKDNNVLIPVHYVEDLKRKFIHEVKLFQVSSANWVFKKKN